MNAANLEKEMIQLKNKLKEYETLIDELSTPIIPSIIPNTILVPLIGALSVRRFRNIQTKILSSIQPLEADAVLIDFTGITLKEIGELGSQEVVFQITQLRDSLDLMGVETIFIGFSPQFAQAIIQANVDTKNLNVHATFRTGLQYIMSKKEIALNKIQERRQC
jgi:rsbT co-antagonist protein RsbR